MPRVIVFGGAGFLGSHIVERFVRRGDDVTVIDGLVPDTGGAAQHLAAVRTAIRFEVSCIEAVPNLDRLLEQADLVVDAMAWTRHLAALADPIRDMQLNLQPHLHLLAGLRRVRGPAVVYLGSRSQYGRVDGVLTDTTPMWPADVQGVHKAAADHHYRVFAAVDGLRVVSVRLPNCFGERQPVAGDDVGLVGGFVRAALADTVVRVYGWGRQRAVLYARDAAEIVVRAADAAGPGYRGMNVGGTPVAIEELARLIVAAAGRGRVEVAPLPDEVAAIDPGDARVDESSLCAAIGEVPRTDLNTALAATVAYFEEACA